VREIIGIVNRLIAAADVAGIPLLVNAARIELEGNAAAPSAPESAGASANRFFLDDEKVVWHLPDFSARLIEDPR
jgi:hypothetical protein